jgi:hypothetical protein
MTAQNIRIMKEARALFWPWCGVMLVGLLHLAGVRFSFGQIDLTVVGFLLGVPLIAALSFGNEFQYRTASLLLAQPVSRIQVWREKLAVMLIAVLSVTLIYYVAWRQFLQSSLLGWVFSAAFLVMVVGSATLWILIARSSIGGLVLNVGVQGSILMVTAALLGVFSSDPLLPTPAFSALLALLVAALCYAGFMLWLGWRKLAGFQATGVAAGPDLLASRPWFIPDSLARSFRWQPAGPTLNLIKKELRLLRPVWLLTIGWIAFLLALTPFKSVARHVSIDFEIIAVVAITMYLILVAILAGSIGMGEERQLGTHSANLTLPVSVRRQWLIKLGCNMSGGAICGLLVILVTYLLLRSELPTGWQLQEFVQLYRNSPQTLIYELCLIVLMALPSFWSACAVDGTVRAAAWTLPGLAALATAPAVARFIGDAHWLNRAINRVVIVAHPFPISNGRNGFTMFFPRFPLFHLLLTTGSVIALALFQSYRMFRREQAESVRTVIGRLVSLWIVLLICIFSTNVVVSYAQAIFDQQRDVLVEVAQAIDHLPLDPAKLDSAHPQPVTLQDMSRVYPLSETARTWLSNADINIYPRPANPLPWLPGKWFGPRPTGQFEAVLQFSNGSECRVYVYREWCRGRGEPFPEFLRGRL